MTTTLGIAEVYQYYGYMGSSVNRTNAKGCGSLSRFALDADPIR
jgi:hypothetical protein